MDRLSHKDNNFKDGNSLENHGQIVNFPLPNISAIQYQRSNE